MERTQHIRGLSLLKNPNQLNSQLHPWWRPSSWRLFYSGMPIGSCVIPSTLEAEHFMVCGATGVGKTTLLRQMLYEIQRRKQFAVVLDPDSEFIQEFADEARGDYVLNPLDARCPFWSPWLEFRSGHEDTDIKAFVTSLFLGQKAPDSKDKFFLDSSRTFIATILAKTRTVQEMLKFVSQPANVIHKLLRDTLSAAAVSPNAWGQSAGILQQVTNAIEDFQILPHQNYTKRMWSAREWTSNPRGWLFLPSKAGNRDSILRLQGLWLDSLVRGLLDHDIGGSRTWIIADELPLLGRQPKIQEALVSGRKRSLSVVMGFQNIAQLDEIYGKDATKTITSQPRTRVFFGGGNSETNKWISEEIGGAEVRRTYQTRTKSVGKSSTSEAEHRLSTHLVTPYELDQLRRQPGRAYLAVGGYDRALITIPKRNLQAKYPDFVPRHRRETSIEPQQLILEPEVKVHASFKSKPEPKALSWRSIWSGMVARCRSRAEIESGLYAKHAQWAHYSGRQRCLACDKLYPGDGRLCPQCGSDQSKDDPVLLLFANWDEIEAEIGPRPAANMTVDRIDPTGHYAVGNVRWLPRERQNANRQNYNKIAESHMRSASGETA